MTNNPVIKVYADADEHGPEREMILAPYFQVLQAIIVQDAVIHPFARGTLSIYFLVLFGIPGDAGLETQVTMVLYINGATVVPRGTRFRVRAGVDASAFERATVLACILDGGVAPWAHRVSRHAQRVSFLVKGDILGGVWRGLRPLTSCSSGRACTRCARKTSTCAGMKRHFYLREE